MDINALSPLEALNKLYELQQMARGGEKEPQRRKGRKGEV
jgi:hypothetical protein